MTTTEIIMLMIKFMFLLFIKKKAIPQLGMA